MSAETRLGARLSRRPSTESREQALRTVISQIDLELRQTRRKDWALCAERDEAEKALGQQVIGGAISQVRCRECGALDSIYVVSRHRTYVEARAHSKYGYGQPSTPLGSGALHYCDKCSGTHVDFSALGEVIVIDPP